MLSVSHKVMVQRPQILEVDKFKNVDCVSQQFCPACSVFTTVSHDDALASIHSLLEQFDCWVWLMMKMRVTTAVMMTVLSCQ